MPELQVLSDEQLSPALFAQLRALVDEAFDGNFTEEDWQHTLGGWRVIAFDGPVPLAHAAVVPRLLRVATRPFQAGYVEAVATHPDKQRTGLGSLVMAAATSLIPSHFELGALSTPRPSFYQRFGWESWRGPSFVEDGPRLIRTADEDDGLMVLRSGPSADIDLTASIACQPRPGDDW
jgi:aminoglycoside 2'-N-acetyltransferase I